LLIAVGRKPNLDSLNLDAAGVKFNWIGISVDDSLKTSNKRIYAIGDVTGKLPYTHVAAYHATLAVRNFLFRWPVIARHEGLPHVTFTQPELAQTGLTEAAAREQKLDIRVLRWPYHENDRAHTEHATEGYLKVITTKRGRILGAGVVGEQAGEVIQLWSLAMQQGIGIRAMASYVAAYPTFTEVNKRAAISYFMPKLTSPLISRVIGWLAKFG
jgi:pyruvate/2-oxoglutarate dehydrogenase complex dihydrolipoamide dehydrogenase (E3) component